jgi:hypothetical protein
LSRDTFAYNRDELYDYETAASVIGVSYYTLLKATSAGILTAVRLPHEQGKFCLRLEVDAIAGLGQMTSKKACLAIQSARSRSTRAPDLPGTQAPQFDTSALDGINTIRSDVREIKAFIDWVKSSPVLQAMIGTH